MSKASIISDLTDRLQQSQATIACDHSSLTVDRLRSLRHQLPEGSSFKVVKNTLAQRAADASATQLPLTGPTALVFINGDLATASKVVAAQCPLKGGFSDGNVFSADDCHAIASLPSRTEQYGQVAVGMSAPQRLVTALAAVAQQRTGEQS